MKHDAQTWADYAEALAFVGNSLLAPMSQTKTVGLEPEFWAGFPAFDDEDVAQALESCAAYAREAQAKVAGGGKPVQDASVEYTRLFVGPPHPEAAPWETMYRPGFEGATVGFGQATFEMRALLRNAGLEISNENNQYADHVGIELLYASVLCGTCAQAAEEGDKARQLQIASELSSFVDGRMLAWVPKLKDAVESAAPAGYISRLLELGIALLKCARIA